MSHKYSVEIWKTQRSVKRQLSFHPEMTSVTTDIFPSACLVISKCLCFTWWYLDHSYSFTSHLSHIWLWASLDVTPVIPSTTWSGCAGDGKYRHHRQLEAQAVGSDGAGFKLQLDCSLAPCFCTSDSASEPQAPPLWTGNNNSTVPITRGVLRLMRSFHKARTMVPAVTL